MINILIADDHPIVRTGLRLTIAGQSDMKVICEASNGLEVMKLLKKNAVEVVILDLSMPGLCGLEVLFRITNLYPPIAVLILSVLSEEAYAVKALRAGAKGFVHKETIPEELIRAIRKVANGGLYISSMLAEKFAGDVKNPTVKFLHENLSFREFQIMYLISSGNTVTEIADTLCISVKTVSTYRTRILEKMDMNNNSEIITYCIKEGLVE
jgi:DNA-binding NarL/FixJ family response regulator